MPLPRSQLNLWAYTAPGALGGIQAVEYGSLIEGLEFTTVAPGGFGDLACILKLKDARIPRPELGLFSRAVFTDGAFTAFSGEWGDPALTLDESVGEYLMLSALGGGVALRDDPDDSSYTAQTVAQIMAAEYSKRSSFLAIDSDRGALFPTGPGSTFSPAYDGFTLEEIVADLCNVLGDYTWGVWDHPINRDQSGFATWRLEAHSRDFATTGYMALLPDVAGWRVAPSSQRAYNVIQAAYIDPALNPGVVTVTDPRLSGAGAQNLAPFRRRKLRINLGRVPMTLAQATVIANAYLAAYQNISNKVEVDLKAVRDANGMLIPLHQVRADRNLYVPELAVRGQTLSGGPSAGVNQFYIVESIYRETARGDVRLRLMLDNYGDGGSSLLAQLRLAYLAAQRQRGAIRQVISPGAPLSGPCGGAFSNQSAGGLVQMVVPFGVTLAKAPSSITLSGISSSNASGIQAINATQTGFTLQWTATGAGATSVIATWTTVGN